MPLLYSPARRSFINFQINSGGYLSNLKILDNDARAGSEIMHILWRFWSFMGNFDQKFRNEVQKLDLRI